MRFFYPLLTILTLVLTLLIGTVGILIFYPSWIFNDWAFQKIAPPLLAREGVNWDHAHFKIESLSLTRKTLKLGFQNLCVSRSFTESSLSALSVCFESAQVELLLNLKWKQMQKNPLERISRLELRQGRVQANTQAQPVSSLASASPSRNPSQAFRWLNEAKLGYVKVDIQTWTIQSLKQPALSGNLTFEPIPDYSKDHEWNLSLTARSAGKNFFRQGKLQAHVKISDDPPLALALDQAVAHWKTEVRLSQGTRVIVNGTLSPKPAKGSFRVVATGLAPWSRLLLEDLPPLRAIRGEECDFEIESGNRLRLKCGLTLTFHENLHALLKADWRWGDAAPEPGHARLEIQPFFAGPTEISGNIEARFIPAHPIAFSFDAVTGVSDFRKVIGFFEKTRWAVPAPLNALGGKIQMETHGTGELEKYISLNAHLAIQLDSPNPASKSSQRFHSETQADLDLRWQGPHPAAALRAKTSLTDVRLTLPPLTFASPPAVLPDSRFHAFAEDLVVKPDEASTFLYTLHFLSPPEHPVRLTSNLAKGRIPMKVDLELSQEALVGNVETGNFPLELFHRDALLEKIRVDFKPAVGGLIEHPLRSTLRVQYADYIVHIDIAGTLEKPVMNLSSSPPLAQDRLWSVLLFGEPLEQLAPDQATSVGDARAALTGGAINFASLYLLASTPIQSINFDPRSGVFTAKLRLGEGTSLNIGADPKELQSIEVQKRLGPQWTITTQLADPTTPERRTLQALLEWNRRY